MTFNPPISLLPFAGPLMVAAVLWAFWLAHRATGSLSRGPRATLACLRLVATAVVALLFLNPGRWQQPESPSARSLVVLADRSASMATPDENGKPRWDAATRLAVVAGEAARTAGYQHVTGVFSSAYEPISDNNPDVLKKSKPDGEGSSIPAALDAALAGESARGRTPAAVVLLSDGRQTGNPPGIDATVARARAFGIPVHTVALGGSWKLKDVRVSCPRRQVLAYPGRPVKIPFTVEATGLGPVEPDVVLRGPDSKEVARTTVRLTGDGRASASFAMESPPAGGMFTIATPALPGEELQTNNGDTIRIRLLSGKSRVFIAEGSPYWDSKFLAQLLRQVPFMEVDSVHRLSDDRFFFLGADGKSSESAGATGALPVFPSTAEALSRYDLIIFGKACEHFLTPERMDLLTAFTRDQGGAVLFARGKPYSREMPGIELLEPVQWGSAPVDAFRFTPTAGGEAGALFGEALPGVDDPVWASLPALQDAREVQAPKPFARVLAHGVPATGGAAPVPVLVVRRFGLGVTGLLNGDGLWKWDFYPEARELGNMYEEFWTQLIQWMASYSEFLPGQDFSLRLSSSRVMPGDTLTMQIGWRGIGSVPEPRLEISGDGKNIATILPAVLPSDDGRPRWQGTWRAPAAGEYRVRVVNEGGGAAPGVLPEALLSVARAPGEMDNLDADPAYLAAISQATGGTATRADGLAAVLDDLATADRAIVRRPPVFTPLWPKAPLFLFLAGLFAADWTIRRRNGLA